MLKILLKLYELLRYKKVINVFLVAGQSNTDGRNSATDPSAPEWIKDGILDNVQVWNGKELTQYNLDIISKTGNGSSWVNNMSQMKFSYAHIALKLVADKMKNVVVCQVSEGGTAINPRPNARGSWNANYSLLDSDTPKLLMDLEERFNALKAYCAANRIKMNVHGLIWHQGESDSFEQADIDAYSANWSGVIYKIREFTGKPYLPIFCGTIPNTSSCYSEQIRNVQMNISTDVYCRDNNDLTMFDGVHFDHASSIRFGEWMADTIKRVLK